MGIYNYVRFGNPMSFGQSWMTSAATEILAAPVSAKDGNHLTEGLLGMIISPGRGVIWYSPCVLLGFVGFFYAYKSKLYESLLIIGFSLIFLVINSGAWWTGGVVLGASISIANFSITAIISRISNQAMAIGINYVSDDRVSGECPEYSFILYAVLYRGRRPTGFDSRYIMVIRSRTL